MNKIKELIEFGLYAAEHGWAPATSGNLSARLDEKTFLQSVSGSDLANLKEEDFLEIKLGDSAAEFVYSGDKKPSAETALHAQFYSRQKNTNAVLHVHANSVVQATMVFEQDFITISGYELQKAIRGCNTHESSLHLPVFTNTQNIPALAKEVDLYMLEEEPQLIAYLIKGHGIYVSGETISEAKRHLEAIDALLTCELYRGNYAAA